MLAKTALLIVTNPKQIGKILPSIQKQVKKTLYIHLLSALSEPFGNFHNNVFNNWPKFSQLVYGIYSQTALHCNNLDVRLLLSGLKYKDLIKIQTKQAIDLVIFDKKYNQDEIENFVKNKIEKTSTDYKILTFDSDIANYSNDYFEDGNVNKHVVLGGTFDRLHVAHKLLLTEAILRSNSLITIGITNENMLYGKTLWELIQPIEQRLENVNNFLMDVCPQLEYKLMPISDPFGPSIVDPTMDLIIVSEETIKGAHKINEIRKENGLKLLEIVPIQLIDEPNPSPIEEKKISSSNTRIRLLGTLFNPIKPNINIPKRPYIIGLTGGIASGKSGVARWLQNLGVECINCDLIGHYVYQKGKKCYYDLINVFGEHILDQDREINRRTLGDIVFKNPTDLEKLNNLVWPAMLKEIHGKIEKICKNKIIVVEAAVLLKAGWQSMCHEVWTTIIPKEEAVKRLIERNNLTEEEANNRISSQPNNTFFVKESNVIFCTFWDQQYTKQQVEKAWALLQQRIS